MMCVVWCGVQFEDRPLDSVVVTLGCVVLMLLSATLLVGFVFKRSDPCVRSVCSLEMCGRVVVC